MRPLIRLRLPAQEADPPNSSVTWNPLRNRLRQSGCGIRAKSRSCGDFRQALQQVGRPFSVAQTRHSTREAAPADWPGVERPRSFIAIFVPTNTAATAKNANNISLIA